MVLQTGGVEVLLSVAQEDNYKDLVDAEVAVEEINLHDGVKDSVADDLAGRIMINHNVFVMQVCESKLNGSYLRKLSLIDCFKIV